MIVAKIDPCTCNCREINIHREGLDGQEIARLEDAVDQMDDALAEIVLKGLRDYSQSYYTYEDGRDFNQSPTVEELDSLSQVTLMLAVKLGIKETE